MKTLTTAIVMLLLATSPLRAEVHDSFVVQLRDQGYSEITVGHTWLGRIVINAQRDDVMREVVLNGRTGEILGDHVTPIILPVQQRNENKDGSRDTDSATATATATDDSATATATDVGVGRELLDSGANAVVGD